MKKIVIFLIISVLLVCNVGSVLADEFTFHKGLKFGMSAEEVKKFEEEVNKSDFDRSLVGPRDSLSDNGIYAETKFTNHSCAAYFSFSNDDKLTSVVFDLNNLERNKSNYDENVKALISKYGDSIASGLKFTRLPSSSMNAVDFSNKQSNYYSENESRFDRYDFTYEDVNQWLVPVDGGYVQIFAILTSFVIRDNFGTGKYYESIYSYDFITEDAYLEYMAKILNQLKQDSDARDNDL